jgi:hypothetical protein
VNGGGDITALKRHGGWRSNTVAEGYIEDSVNEKIKTARKIQGGLGVSESTGVKSLNAVCNATSGITANESLNLVSPQSNTPKSFSFNFNINFNSS